MLFSVCIPVYNTSKYLDECIESVLAQTEKDYEIVLVDDGSTDDSGEKCDRYAAEYPFIRVIHKANEGLMMTRRRGFREGKGDYFICLDSDDHLCDPTAFSQIRKMIEEKNCDLVVYNYIAGKENPANNKKIRLFDRPNAYVFTEEEKKALYDKLLIGNGFNAIWIKCPSRAIVDIDTDHSVWQKDICRGEDLFQSYPMLNNAKRVGYLNGSFVEYRWTPGSISNNPKLKYYNAYRRIYLREDSYLEKWDCLDEATKKKAHLRRIPMVLNVLIGGYHAGKKKGDLREWKAFMKKVSGDDFFASLFPKAYKKSINKYYWFLGRMIRKNHIFLLARTIDAYDWYLKHIKSRKGKKNAA